MTTSRRKWKGWLKPEDIDPDLLARIRDYNERFKHHQTRLGYHELTEAHRLACLEVPLTEEEFETKQRLLDTAQNLTYKNSRS